MTVQNKLAPVAHAPHVPLTDYYADEQSRGSFVRDMFDSTAEDYDRMEHILGFGTGMWYRGQALERAGRVADFLEFAETLVTDAHHRRESCGGHFREEFQTPEGEALRDDQNFSYVAAWEFKGVGQPPVLHKEPLAFEEIQLSQRSYK